jgi:GxxExxY protein
VVLFKIYSEILQKQTKRTKDVPTTHSQIPIKEIQKLEPKPSAPAPSFPPLPFVQKESGSMHPLYHKADLLSEVIIGAAIEVHRDKGPGLIETIYEWCLTKELDLKKLGYVSQKPVEISYKGFVKQEDLRLDILVEDCILVEAKSVAKIIPIHKAQLLSYMKLLNIPIGLLMNFNEMKLIDGVHRMMLPGANKEPQELESNDIAIDLQ